jgi:hypothetical protein
MKNVELMCILKVSIGKIDSQKDCELFTNGSKSIGKNIEG